MRQQPPASEEYRLQSDFLSKLPNIRHGFFTRRGGVSQGLYESLNCGFGSGDRHQAVAENRARVAGTFDLDAGQLITARQTHSSLAVATTAPWDTDHAPEADAIVTSATGFALAVLTADCAPVLMADPKVSIIAAVHAGWRGALAGILSNAVAKMLQLGAQRHDICAVIGPALSPVSYEVGPEFRDLFLTHSPQNASFFKQSAGDRFLFDLPGFIQLCLRNCGVLNISNLDLCTYGGESDFFSYRRSVHRKERDYGRQISVIGLV